MAGYTTQFSTGSRQSYVRGARLKSMDSFRLTASCENNDDDDVDLTRMGHPPDRRRQQQTTICKHLAKDFHFCTLCASLSVRIFVALWEEQEKGEKKENKRQRGRAGKRKKTLPFVGCQLVCCLILGHKICLICKQMRLAALTGPDNHVHHLHSTAN